MGSQRLIGSKRRIGKPKAGREPKADWEAKRLIGRRKLWIGMDHPPYSGDSEYGVDSR